MLFFFSHKTLVGEFVEVEVIDAFEVIQSVDFQLSIVVHYTATHTICFRR